MQLILSNIHVKIKSLPGILRERTRGHLKEKFRACFHEWTRRFTSLTDFQVMDFVVRRSPPQSSPALPWCTALCFLYQQEEPSSEVIP